MIENACPNNGVDCAQGTCHMTMKVAIESIYKRWHHPSCSLIERHQACVRPLSRPRDHPISVVHLLEEKALPMPEHRARKSIRLQPPAQKRVTRPWNLPPKGRGPG